MTTGPSASRASIDRFEDDLAVLVTDDGATRHVPRAQLPAGAQEGDVILLDSMTVDAEATRALRAEVTSARARAKKHRAPPGDL